MIRYRSLGTSIKFIIAKLGLGMKLLKGPFPIAIICFFYLCKLAIASTPVSDDYCMAYGSKSFGVFNSFWYLNSNWTPSLSYLYSLGIWALPFSPLTISRLAGFTALLLSTIFLIIALLRIFDSVGIKNLVNSVSVLLIGFIGSLGIIQYSIFSKTISSGVINPIEIGKNWTLTYFTQFRDGEILRWMYGTSLTSTRVVLASAIMLFVVQESLTKSDKNFLHSLRYQFLPALLALALGLSTESLTFLAYLVVSSIFLILKNKSELRRYVLLVIIVIGIISLYEAPGSRFRDSLIPDRTILKYVLLFIANFWNMSWILLFTLFVSFLTSRLILRFSMGIHIVFPYSLKRNFRVLGLSAICAQLVIETGAYPAAYHWVTCIWIFFLWTTIEFISIENLRESRFVSLHSHSFIFYALSLILIVNLAITSQVAGARRAALTERAEDSKRLGIQNTRVVPSRDNLGNFFSTDLQPVAKTIVPFRGYIEGATVYCYVRLPLGF